MPINAGGILYGSFVLLRSRWQVTRNTFWRGSARRKAGVFALVGAVLALSYGLYRLSRLVVATLQTLGRERPAAVAELGDLSTTLAALPGIALATAVAPLLLSSVSFALASLYLASDLDLLLVTPVPRRSVFLARFVEGLLPIYGLLFVLLFPSLAGYGQALGYGIVYVAALPPILLLLPLLPMSVGTLLTMALVRIIPPRRLRELMAILGGLLGLFIYVGTQLVGRASSRLVVAATAERLLWLDSLSLPTSWASRIPLAAATGDLPALLRYGLPYCLGSIGLFAVTVAFAERLYHAGWINFAGSTGGRSRRREGAGPGRPWLRGPTGAILRKDLQMLPRDPQRLSQLLLPLALSAFWGWQLVTGRSGRGGPSGLLTGLTSVSLLVCVLLTSNLGLTGVSREGRGYWLLRLAPISPWPTLLAKWTLAFLPFPIIGTLFVILIGLLREPPIYQLLGSWAIVLITGLGVSGITTGFGAAYPRFDWVQPNRMTSIRAGCLAPIAYYGYTGMILVLTMGASMAARRWGQIVVVGGWSAAILLTVAALVLPLRLAASRMRRTEL